jgi:hypothetical protein
MYDELDGNQIDVNGESSQPNQSIKESRRSGKESDHDHYS